MRAILYIPNKKPPETRGLVQVDKATYVSGPEPVDIFLIRQSQWNQMAICQMLSMKNTVPVRKKPARKTSPSFFII